MEEMTPSGESSPPLPGARFSLEQNYPNPFNPSTAITYSLPQSGHCRLVIYDVRGRLIRVLVDRETGAGRYCVLWDGRDEAGRPVGSGVYLYKLTAGEKQEIRRMVLLK
jgi:flagellar hook assembly protein FlgD